MNRFELVNWWSVLVAAASTFVVGGLWYGPLFQKPWMRLSGVTKEQGAKQNPAVVFGGAFALALLAAAGIALLNGAHSGWLFGLHTGLAGAFFFIAPALGIIYLFESRPFGHWLVNAAYMLVSFALMGAIIGAWPR